VRQPEVVRLTSLLLALVFAFPVLRGVERVLVAAAFLVEFSNDAWTALSALTAAPVEHPRTLTAGRADAFVPRTLRAPPPLVLVHGAAAEGKDDPRARRAARLLARAGFDVTLPTLAAADPRVRDRVALVITLGGYGSATELVRFSLTGAYGYGAASGHREHDPALVRLFVAVNADILADAAGVRALLDTLSPVRVARDVTAPLLLVHGRDDRVVPFTESMRLADAASPTRTTLVIVDVLGHIGAADEKPDWRALGALWGVAYRLVATR
jgi:2,6-dihydroxypseudooxynicotine hydrolase